mgnify:CR=1 FL=1
MFEINDVIYKDILKIDHLKIPTEKVSCIVGESGGGKTTFLKLLNNMISPDSGQIYYNEKNLREYDPVKLRRKIAMLPQEATVFSGTIEDNFKLTIEYADLNNLTKNNFKDLLKSIGLYHSLDKNADKLSGGEKQRLALDRTLFLKPDVLLLDEPSSALDQKTEDEVINMIIKIMDSLNGTVIMVTHSKKIAKKYGDLILTIDKGKITNIEKQ